MARRGRLGGSRLALLALALLGLASLAIIGRSAAAVPSAADVVLIPPAQARAGELITVRLVARNARGLAGYQGAVQFDPARLRYVSAEIAGGLAGGGRGILPLGPVERSGAVALGAATCPIADCNDLRRAATVQAMPGVDGQVDLGSVSFYAATPGHYQLTLADVRLVDAQGNQLASTTAGTSLDVIAP